MPPVSAARVERALLAVAKLVERDPVFAPVFERLEAELAAAREAEQAATEAQRRARALLASQRERGEKRRSVL